MIYNFSNNRGMYTEDLINKTIQWYFESGVAYFKKAHVPVAVHDQDGNAVCGNLTDKADVDYYGVYKGKYICFESKETKQDIFSLLAIKEHQMAALKRVSDCGGYAFLILNYANTENSVYAIEFNRLEQLFINKVKRLNDQDIKNVAVHLPIEFPGVIDFIKCLEIDKHGE